MKLFCIFGSPIKHSKSTLMHNFTFKSLGEKACYRRYLLEDGKLLRDKFLELKLNGANITVPHKEAAFKSCDEVRGIARKIGAVNTIVLENSKLIGYNTDAPGFFESIKDFNFKNVLILGAGGTAKAIAEFFSEKNIDFSILNRSENRLRLFKEKEYKAYSWKNFEIGQYDLIVNTTSAGLNDENFPAPKEILEALFKNAKYAVDAIYGKKTPFLKLAFNKGLTIKDGEDMLLFQGVLAFEIFTHFKYDKKTIEKYMRKGLSF